MAASATALHGFPMKLTASWDTQDRPPYTPHRTYPKNPNTLTPANLTTEHNLKSNSTDRNVISVSALLTRKSPTPSQARLEETYLGYDTWMPSAPKVEKPRSTYNAASLAYIGDCIFEVCVKSSRELVHKKASLDGLMGETMTSLIRGPGFEFNQGDHQSSQNDDLHGLCVLSGRTLTRQISRGARKGLGHCRKFKKLVHKLQMMILSVH